MSNEFQVNHTAITQNDEVFDDECPDTNYGESNVCLFAFPFFPISCRVNKDIFLYLF